MALFLLLHWVDMSSTKVFLFYDDPASKGRAPVKLEQAQSSVALPLLFTLEMRVLRSNQGLYRPHDITQLPVTCLDMHAHHLVTVSRNPGYKRCHLHGNASCPLMVDK